jgi:hypothetical protein
MVAVIGIAWGTRMKRTLAASALLAVLLSVTCHAIAADPTGNKYALLVGVGEYDHPKFRTLKFAEADVSELGATLKAGGFQVTQLTGSDGAKNANLKPTKANVIRELDKALNACTKHDMVLIALSGHGVQPNGSKENFFCPADARVQDLQTLIGMADLYERLDRSAAEVKLILADCCRDDPAEGKGITKVPLPPEGVGVLLSCSPGETAYEHASMKHGVFYYFVLDALKNRKAMNDDGKITFGLLAEYVQRRVSRVIPKLIGDGAKQSPNLVVNISGESPILLTPSNKEGTTVARNDPPPEPDRDTREKTNTKSATEAFANPIAGSWVAQNETVFFHKDGSVVWLAGSLYLKGLYSLDQGVLDLSFTDIKWDIRVNLSPVNGQPNQVRGQVFETNIPGFKIGHQFVWTRANRDEPAAPPTRHELVGSWTDGTVTYTMSADHTFVVRYPGGQMSGKYGYGGNVLLVYYKEANAYSFGLMAWADPQNKTTVRSKILASNLQGASPPGTVTNFTRVP